ncbi:hypothetical protein AVEN_17388-1 [Araneus ventricosus]|uniref:Uncharacterized protein n=1 Tax=Araneus ventricosus TaxID=182803 RepID=A0A4Y2IBG3_ARAVE|nr:hypothetical protein AVEN_17388-1 [Araneus ventricosus]
MAAISPNHPEHIKIKNCSDAEALVAKFPDSSKAWVDGALTYFHYGGISKSREILQRGIKTINSM